LAKARKLASSVLQKGYQAQEGSLAGSIRGRKITPAGIIDPLHWAKWIAEAAKFWREQLGKARERL